MKHILFILLAVLCTTAGFAQSPLRLPSFFADGMVLQRETRIPVWGWGESGATVIVKLNGKSAKTTVKSDGTWSVSLPKMKACSVPGTMTVDMKVKGTADIDHQSNGTSANGNIHPDGKQHMVNGTRLHSSVRNVLIGDVFLCSGQSNMELPVRRCMDKVADLVNDYSNSQVRYLKFPHQYNYVHPNDDVHSLRWQDITPKNCAEVSAICYFMARELQQEKNVPIGIINSAVGGTRVESWMPKEALLSFAKYENEFDKVKYHQQNWPDSINRVEQQESMKWEREMIAGDTVVNRWRHSDYDFSSWQRTSIFNDWSDGRHGSFWFRFTLTIDASDASRAATLRMGAMKDADSIFVNGTFVGNTTYEYPPRIYKVPEGVLREGENVIMVHLMAQSGKPSFTKGKLYQLEIGDKIYKVSEDCQMCLGKEMSPKPSSTYFVDCPTGLYNAMIAPLRNFAFRGILWYQGESNQGMKDYADYLKAMVDSWRSQFGRELPIVIMQLPGYMARHQNPVGNSWWCDMRESQRQASLIIPKSALGVTLDTGEWNDIHPQDKQVAGHRAALLMRKLAYGEKRLECEGPRAVSAKRQTDGSVLVSFDDGQTKLVKESNVTWAIWGDTLRYCYDDYPVPEIFSKSGIPTPQFEIKIE